jgi:Uma2 family endonuclease
MIYCIESLQSYFVDRPEVYVSGNDFLYYEEGNPKARVSPDCYVVFGVAKYVLVGEETRLRDSYKVWQEGGRVPSVVFEFTSRKTRKEDTGTKFGLYEQVLKVEEYFQFDPTKDYLRPPLQGYRLVDGRYVPIALEGDRLHSEQLGLDLVMTGETLRLYDPVRGEWLNTLVEEKAARMAEKQRADREAEARAVEAQARAAEARARAAEARRADEAEAELARLRAELEALRRKRE